MYEERKQRSVRKIILGLGLALCLLGNLALGAYHLQKADTNNQKVAQFMDEQRKYVDDQLEKQAEEAEKKNTYQEDGYVVASQYEIRSTKNISDAYLNDDDSALSDTDKETLKLAKKILEKQTKKCKNNYEKEKAIYEWMYRNIKERNGSRIAMPNDEGNNYTPGGVLRGKAAVCVGYATTFRLFMNMLGMECHIVHNEDHSWDLVKMDDDQWYHVDVYNDVSSSMKYSNFNMPDGVAKSNHDWDGSMLPVAKGTKYTYPMQNHKKLKDIYMIPKKVKEAMEKKKTALCFSFKKKLKEKDITLIDAMYEELTSALFDSSQYDDYSISANWYDDEKGSYILGIFVGKYGDSSEENTDISKKQRKKIIQCIEQVFGL